MGEACTPMGTMRIENSILLKSLKEGEHKKNPELDGSIILKYILNY
jgi:hypothetical protein